MDYVCYLCGNLFVDNCVQHGVNVAFVFAFSSFERAMVKDNNYCSGIKFGICYHLSLIGLGLIRKVFMIPV